MKVLRKLDPQHPQPIATTVEALANTPAPMGLRSCRAAPENIASESVPCGWAVSEGESTIL